MAEYYEQPEPDEHTELMMDFGEGIDDPAPAFAQVVFLNLEKDQMFEKVQCRVGGVARQVLENAVIQMKATFSPAHLCQIVGSVRREAEAAKLVGNMNDVVLMKNEQDVLNLAENFVDHEHGAIPIPEVIDGRQYLTLRFYVDLGKVYSGPKYPLFKLVKTDTAVRNRFQLRVQLQFLDREPSEVFDSPIFRCRTKKSSKVDQPPSPPVVPPETPPEPPSPSAITSMQVITDSLVARTAQIQDLVFGSMSTAGTPNADIAYHLRIKDEEIGAELEEGDVVGFFTDEDDGGTYVKLLRSNDSENAVHAGVVSRSYYIDANRMAEDEGKTDTVCVIGMVNIKVIGSVENGERVYASIDRPGKAIPQSHLPVGSFLRKKHVLLGMSMERKFPKSLEEEHLVKCFVCIVLDVGRQDILNEVEGIYEMSEKSTKEQIKFASKKACQKLTCCFGTTFVFILLLGFLLYQVFVPGSMFRYWLCRRGSISGELRVTVVPYRSITERISVHGIRFTYEKLKDKVSDHFTRNKKTGNRNVYYFLNLDRCAYFGDQGPVRDFTTGKYRTIGGGKILSTDVNCKTVYWFGLHPNHTAAGFHWYPYVSAEGLECLPEPPYG